MSTYLAPAVRRPGPSAVRRPPKERGGQGRPRPSSHLRPPSLSADLVTWMRPPQERGEQGGKEVKWGTRTSRDLECGVNRGKEESDSKEFQCGACTLELEVRLKNDNK